MLNPKNELGVIVIFSQICEENGYSIARIDAGFPDATVINNESGESFEVEFEFVSSNFAAHRHDPRGCDVIVCWENDLGKAIDGFPVVCLSKKEKMVLFKIDNIQKELAYLRMRNRYLENKMPKYQSVPNLPAPKEPSIKETSISLYLKNNSQNGCPSIRTIASALGIATSTTGAIMKKMRERGEIQ